MSPPPVTPQQQALWGQDRRPALYGSLIALLAVNNIVAMGRLLAHYRAHYRHNWGFKRVFVEDYFTVLSALCIDAVIGNLLAATHYGLGLHSWRINAEDPNYPQDLSNTFKHVWITMIFTGPTFASIKLTLLFFYRRLFLVNQKWLRIAWWLNLVYVILWLFGATGFYVFQCVPVQWYYMQYYKKYNVPPPYPINGQCNATTTTHVSIPLIFGLFSDVMILLLPLTTIFRLQMSKRAKIGLCLVFSIGIIACLLDMVRIIELLVDTDDKIDPSYGVVIFLILSAATEVTALVCACLPVIGPQALSEYKKRRHPSYEYQDSSTKLSTSAGRSRFSKGFEQLGSNHGESLRKEDSIALGRVDSHVETLTPPRRVSTGMIWVESEFGVTIRDGNGDANITSTA